MRLDFPKGPFNWIFPTKNLYVFLIWKPGFVAILFLLGKYM